MCIPRTNMIQIISNQYISKKCHTYVIIFYFICICLRFFLSEECSLFVWIVSVFLFYNFFSSNSDIISHIVYIFYIRVSSVTQYEVIITVTRLVGSAVSTSSQFIVKTHQHQHNRTMGYFQGFSGPEDFLVTLFSMISLYVS